MGSHMHKTKQTMYEILEISPNASDSEIRVAYQRLSQKLHLEINDTNREDINFKLKVIDVAFNTLTEKSTRDAYDARMAMRNPPDNAATSLSLVPSAPKDEASLKAEAISLKSEAMSLKADALSLKADVMALKAGTGYSLPPEHVLDKTSRLLSPVKKAFTIVGGLIAIGMVVQVLFLLLMNRHAGQAVGDAAKAEEKVMLQDYYQRTGVRVNSKTEMDLLEAADRREEQKQQALKEQEREQGQEQTRQEDQHQRFVEEARREGEQVSANLRRAEESARYEEEMKRRGQAEEKRRKEEEESLRIEREKDRLERERERLRNSLSNSQGN
jgi:hypothetical protein